MRHSEGEHCLVCRILNGSERLVDIAIHRLGAGHGPWN